MTDERPQGILLDLDDTILAFDSVAHTSWQSTCAQFANDLHPVLPEQLISAIERQARVYWGDAERHRIGRMNLEFARTEIIGGALGALGALGIQKEDLAGRIAKTYGTVRDQAVQPFPGAIQTLETLRDWGIKLALVTNGSAEGQRHKIRRFDLESYFDSILIEGELGIGKPDPRVYARALEELNLPPNRVWMIGDNFEWEVLAPQRMGMKGIWVQPSGHSVTTDAVVQPYKVIRTLPDILTLLNPSHS